MEDFTEQEFVQIYLENFYYSDLTESSDDLQNHLLNASKEEIIQIAKEHYKATQEELKREQENYQKIGEKNYE
jgi:hypothetical protein